MVASSRERDEAGEREYTALRVRVGVLASAGRCYPSHQRIST